MSTTAPRSGGSRFPDGQIVVLDYVGVEVDEAAQEDVQKDHVAHADVDSAGRDGIDAAAARARIDAQMPVEEKRAFAHIPEERAESLRKIREAIAVARKSALERLRVMKPGLKAAR